jgi:hypothetical protein
MSQWSCQLIQNFPQARVLDRERVIFNIGWNCYRLIVARQKLRTFSQEFAVDLGRNSSRKRPVVFNRADPLATCSGGTVTLSGNLNIADDSIAKILGSPSSDRPTRAPVLHKSSARDYLGFCTGSETGISLP